MPFSHYQKHYLLPGHRSQRVCRSRNDADVGTCRTVILFRPQELHSLTIFRPQFDVSAIAVIITKQEKVQKYEKLVSGEELLESW